MCRAYTKNTASAFGAQQAPEQEDDPFGALLDDFELYGLEGDVVGLAAVKAESGEYRTSAPEARG